VPLLVAQRTTTVAFDGLGSDALDPARERNLAHWITHLTTLGGLPSDLLRLS